MSFLNLKSVALYSLLAVGQGVSGRALLYDASVSRREETISLITAKNTLPRHVLNKRVDVPVVEPKPEPAPVTGPEAQPVPGVGDPTNSPGSRPPAIGSPEAGELDPAANPGTTGTEPPAIGAPQVAEPDDTHTSPKLDSDNTGDGIKSGKDTNDVAFVKDFATRIQDTVPVEKRNAVFYTDKGDRNQMQDYIDSKMKGNAYSYFNIFDSPNVAGTRGGTEDLIPAGASKSVRFMGIYRGSRAVAQETRGEEVFVVLQRDTTDDKKRNIFDPVEIKKDPDSTGVGQVWNQVELPTLIRNPNVKKITAIQKINEEWNEETQWNRETDLARHPIDSVPLISLDDKVRVPKVPGSKH